MLENNEFQVKFNYIKRKDIGETLKEVGDIFSRREFEISNLLF